jgi:alkylation response protein AidB-like acyl-CoA dehydrogenase
MNIFTFRIEQAVREWPDKGWDVALFFSEYGPMGLPPEERPAAFERMWRAIESARGPVLGGVFYCWTIAGPERVDVAFGLVDKDSQPIDDLLEVIGEAYRR